MKRQVLWWSLVLCVAIFSSCSVTRHIPKGEYLLAQNEVVLNGKVPRKERITASQIEPYIKQSPNKRFLGTNFYLWVYNLARPGKNNMFSRLYRKIGQAPVILDTMQIRSSLTNISNFMESSGFYDARESYRIEADTAKRKAKVVYTIEQGTPYRIGKISYQFRDNVIGPVIMADSAESLLRKGEIFSENILNEERSRITTLLKNKGYFNFAVDNIVYYADSTVGNHTINLKMVVKQYVAGYNDRGEPILENFTVYRIRDIFINPDYDPIVGATDSMYNRKLDTMQYRGLSILCDHRPKVRKEMLRQLVSLYPNHIYDANDVNRTYENIMKLGYYKSASIVFNEVKTAEQNMITFIGSDGKEAVTTEGYLDCTILCTPALKQSYKIEFEASTNSNFYAFTGTIGYQNRNILRGADLLDVSFTGGYEIMHVKGKKGSYEVGGAVSMMFPRLIAPTRIDRYNRLNNPRTKLEFTINSQSRPYYDRTLSGMSWGYMWNNRKHSSYTLRPVDVNLVKMGYINGPDFFDLITNRYLKTSYQSQLVAGISGSYVFNNQKFNSNTNSVIFRLNVETMGNLINGLSKMFNAREYTDSLALRYNKVFGIRFAQYVRADASFANKIRIGDRSSIVYRLWAGAGVAYGNSVSLPYDRLFYAGGSNSMRGWMVRTLGPGTTMIEENDRYPQQVGDLRLEANLEARFPVWGIFHGAVFFDLGNIWYMKQSQGIQPDEVFHFDTFYKQLGLNTGLGLRLDLNFFVLRFDWGIKLHNPNWAPGQRWIRDFKFKNTALHFGVGYPF